jgi:uncharacterized damage-inducible protein DinB
LNELQTISAQMKEKFCNYTEDELIRTLELNTPWAKNKLSRYEYVIHVINHTTFHRGQIVTMLRSLGVTEGIPNTDYNLYHTKS